jgi:hypothetical protein
MIEGRSPTDLVLTLVQVINGDRPLLAAQDILDPAVRIHMDTVEFSGIDSWYKWIHLIHNCGRVAEPRITHCEARCDARDPNLVHLSARWTGIDRSQRGRTTSARTEARYLVLDGRIKAMWTHKSNYQFIFGRWIRYSICYWIFLGWSMLYFLVLSTRKKDLFQGSASRSASAGKGC